MTHTPGKAFMSTIPEKPRFNLIPELYVIGEKVAAEGGRPVLVGGWVRDVMMGIPHTKDFDLEVFGVPLSRLRNLLRPFGYVHSVGRHFGVLKLNTREAEYDVSVPRRESNIGKGHRGFWVKTDPGMAFEEASSRRDFTINSMGYAFLEDEILDPFNGQHDLKRKLLRHVGPAFGEDPLRVLRAMQFAGRFGFSIAEETLAICREQDLSELPAERIFEEFKKLLLRGPHPSKGMEFLNALGVLPHFPELEAVYHLEGEPGGTAWKETLAMVDQAAKRREGDSVRDLVLMLAALCHHVGNPPEASSVPQKRTEADRAVGSFLSRLTNSTDLLKQVFTLLADLQSPELLYERSRNNDPQVEGAIRRLALRVSIPFLEKLAESHFASRHPNEPYAAGQWLGNTARLLDVWAGPPEPLLKGRHLLDRGADPGRKMGDMLKQAFEKQLDGGIQTLEEALAWVNEQGINWKGDKKAGEGGRP